jgi:hypothetical protein
VARRVCVVDGCGAPVRARGYCNTHYRRWQVHGDPRADVPIERKTAGGVSYWSVHQRLKTDRGPASARRCAECGGPAVDWSYDGSDPDERIYPARGWRYSLDLDRYRPRCRSCHRRATVGRRFGQPLDVRRAARLYAAGATARGIGSLLNVSGHTVLAALRAHGVAIRRGGRQRR